MILHIRRHMNLLHTIITITIIILPAHIKTYCYEWFDTYIGIKDENSIVRTRDERRKINKKLNAKITITASVGIIVNVILVSLCQQQPFSLFVYILLFT